MVKRTIGLIGVVLGLVAGCADDGTGTAPSNGTTQQASAARSESVEPASAPTPAPTVPRPRAALGAAITIDGVKCADAAELPWLEPATEGRWILNLEAPACDVLIQISGDTAKGYPQTGADAWEGQPHIKLFKAVPNSSYVNEHLLSHETKPGSEGTVAVSGKHFEAWGTLSAWEGFELPKMHEIVVDITIP